MSKRQSQRSASVEQLSQLFLAPRMNVNTRTIEDNCSTLGARAMWIGKISFRHAFALMLCICFTLPTLADDSSETEEPALSDVTPVGKADLQPWREIPAYHHGRVMPLDTLAKVVGETVCNNGSGVKISMEGYYTQEELKTNEELWPALEMFPRGTTGKISTHEMLLSWLVEQEKWEDVPFILCEHKDLHKVLGVSSITEGGVHRKFVSPRQIAESEDLQFYLEDFNDRMAAKRSADLEFEPNETDKQVREMLDRYRVFRKLTHDPRLPLKHSPVMMPGSRDELLIHLRFAMDVLMTPNETKNQSMLDSLRQFIELQQRHGLKSEIADTSQMALHAMGQLQQLQDRMRPPAPAMGEMPEDYDDEPLMLEEVEAAVVNFRLAALRLHEVLDREKDKVFDEGNMNEAQAETLRPLFDELAKKAQKLSLIGQDMHLSLYDNGGQFSASGEFRYGAGVYVTPALNAEALKKQRDTKKSVQPWLALPAVLHGSDELLYGEGWPEQNYDRGDVKNVRAAWSELAKAYTDRENEDRPQRVHAASEQLAKALRNLGEGVEPDRVALVEAQLAKKDHDEQMLAYTQYPAPDRLDAELKYNRVKPFRWSWVVCLLSVMAFGLAFGVMRKGAFWTGVGLLSFAVLWTGYGFYLRILVTQWAPVTNMFETVIFVPWVVAVLALWFLLLPILSAGIKDAWRLVAIPGTWEATRLDERRKQLLDPLGWTVFGALATLGRALLMAFVFYQLARVPYADGNRTIFYLLPNTDAVNHSSISDMLNVYGVYVVNLLCLLGIVWFLPRILLAALASFVTVPLSWVRGGGRNSFGEMLSLVHSRKVFGIAGAAVAGFFFMIVAFAPTILDENFRPLQPVLRSNFWLTIHVLTIVASYGAGLLAWGMGLIGLTYYLFGKYRAPVVAANVPKGMQPARGEKAQLRLGRQPPEQCATLANYSYRAVQIAVLLLAAGTILGGLWADVSWGRFWGWDPKEVWALISTLVYLAILHGRFAGWFNNFGMTAGTVIGAIMIAGSWYGVNFILPMISPDGTAGLHSYGSGSGGQAYVFGFIGLNIIYLIAASIRYSYETRAAYAPVEHTPEVAEVFPAKVAPSE